MGRLGGITPFIVMEILEKAKELERRGRDIVHMEIGEPDLPPSPKVLEALKELKGANLGYTDSLGIWELREAIARYYWETYGVDISPERVIVTTGTSGGFSLIFSALFEVGEGIVFTDPGYPCYKNFARVYCLKPLTAKVEKETDYELTPEVLEEINQPFKGFLVTSPSNPLGNIYKRETLKALVEYAHQRGKIFISDEIYHGLNYSAPVHTALEFGDDVIVVNGFSKYFCMPGFRLGWVVVPQRFVKPLRLVVQNLFISPPTPSQLLALKALEDRQYLREVRETFRKRRDYLYGELKKLFDIPVEPQGAFYIWANVGRYAKSGYEFSLKLLEEVGVATTPGVDFGNNNTQSFVRFSYTSRLERLREGVRRIKLFLERLKI
ncbi:MAG: pyridoxal phosphate-dependent aminotransferase [Gammaproteobacteria bacterium]|nr:MAG: pyridoxal phosphate-dependent aminotransferase [Gammaproteobacteria bacterium]